MSDITKKDKHDLGFAERRVPQTVEIRKIDGRSYFELVIPAGTHKEAFEQAQKKLDNFAQNANSTDIGCRGNYIGEDFSFYFNSLNGNFRAIDSIKNASEQAEIAQAVLDDLLSFVQNTPLAESDHFSSSFAKLSKKIWDSQPTQYNADQFIAFQLLQAMCRLDNSPLNYAETIIPLYIALNGDVPTHDTSTEITPTEDYIHPEVRGAFEILRQYPDLPGRFVKEIKAWHASTCKNMGMESMLDVQNVAMSLMKARVFENVQIMYASLKQDDPIHLNALIADGFLRRAKIKLNEKTLDGKMTRNNIEDAHSALCKAKALKTGSAEINGLKVLLESKFTWLNKDINPSTPVFS